jgi:hypothetical protein
MSIRILGDVLLLALPPVRKLVLVALADNANDTGYCWPNQETVAAKASISERNCRVNLHALVADDWITVVKVGNGRGNSSQYLLNVERIKCQASAFSEKGAKADLRDTKADLRDTKADAPHQTNRQEPSLIEPSVISRARRSTLSDEFLQTVQGEEPDLDIPAFAADYLNWTGSSKHTDKERGFRNQLRVEWKRKQFAKGGSQNGTHQPTYAEKFFDEHVTRHA